MMFTARDCFERFQSRLLDRLALWAAHASDTDKQRTARLLTHLVSGFLPIRVAYVKQALRERLSLSATDAAITCRRVYQAFFRNALEASALSHLSATEVKSRFDVQGLGHLQEALAAKKGVIIVSGHYGLWELIPSWLVLHGYPMTVVVRRQNNVHVDRWMHTMRTCHGVYLTDSGFSLREILRALKNGSLLGLMSDQDAGTKGIFVPFFGKEASTVVGPAEISRKVGCPIVVVGGHPRSHPPHLLEISPALYPDQFPTGAEGAVAITRAYTQILENWIRRRPEQWFWLHRRWKTRPAEKPPNEKAADKQ
jgi:KDO2-lipid IV(A) lauroyltransferase